MNSRTKLRNIPHIRSISSEKSTSFNGKAGDHSSTLSSRPSALDMTRGGMGARNDKGVSLRIGSGDVVVAGTEAPGYGCLFSWQFFSIFLMVS